MKQIVLTLSACVLVAVVPARSAVVFQSPASPGFATNDEPCLQEQGFNFLPDQPDEPSWVDCTVEEARAAIERQCLVDEPTGTVARQMCITRRQETDDRRRASLAPTEISPPSATTAEAADQACRGQMWRHPDETRLACIDRLVATEALSRPLPTGREPTPPGCVRTRERNEDGTGFRVSVRCHETTTSSSRQ